MLSMLLEEEKQREAELAALTYECNICGDDVTLDNMLTLECDHRFCKDCFTQFCEAKISLAAVQHNQLKCPDDDCSKPISIHELQGNLDPALFARYNRFCLRAYAEGSSDALFCPGCQEWFCEVCLLFLRRTHLAIAVFVRRKSCASAGAADVSLSGHLRGSCR